MSQALWLCTKAISQTVPSAKNDGANDDGETTMVGDDAQESAEGDSNNDDDNGSGESKGDHDDGDGGDVGDGDGDGGLCRR